MGIFDELEMDAGHHIHYYENDQKAWEGECRNGKEEGLWTFWYMNGQKGEERWFKAGKRWSSKVWKPNGEECPVTNMKDGNGFVVYYLHTGQIEMTGSYKDSGRHGLWTFWHPNGRKRAEGHLKEDKLDGFQKYWHANGQWEAFDFYRDGKHDGPCRHWYSTGRKLDERTYEKDKLIRASAWKPNGAKCDVSNVEGGNGTLILYEEDGTECCRNFYENGIEAFD